MSFHSYQTNLTPSELATIVMDAQEDLVPLTMIASPSDEWVDYVTTRYGIDTQEIVDGVVCYPFGVNASEIAILRYQNEEAAQNGVSQLEQYAQLRAAAFAGYAPEEAALLEQAIAIAYGDYAALFICPDPQSAIETFKDCFKKSSTPAADSGGSMTSPGFASSQGFPSSSDSTSPQDTTSPPVPTSAQDSTSSQDPTSSQNSTSSAQTTPTYDPSQTDAQSAPYDGDAVRKAIESNNPSALSGKSLAVYELVIDTIDTLITTDMSDYEKELAIHDFIVNNTGYDMESLSASPDASPDPDHANPYGALIHGKSICFGYTSSFQLFMDVLGIECISIVGLSHETEDHGWNMVRLDGEWYCVDVGWDDPFAGYNRNGEMINLLSHEYFNVTSDYMRRTSHKWDEESIPEATATKYAYKTDKPFSLLPFFN